MCSIFEKLPEFKVRHSCFALYCSIDITCVILQVIISIHWKCIYRKRSLAGNVFSAFAIVWIYHRATEGQSHHLECVRFTVKRYCVYWRFDRPFPLFRRFALTTFRRENIYEDKHPRFLSFFLFVSLPFHLVPRSYQSMTVVTIPTGAKASKPWPDLPTRPMHPVNVNICMSVREGLFEQGLTSRARIIYQLLIKYEKFFSLYTIFHLSSRKKNRRSNATRATSNILRQAKIRRKR